MLQPCLGRSTHKHKLFILKVKVFKNETLLVTSGSAQSDRVTASHSLMDVDVIVDFIYFSAAAASFPDIFFAAEFLSNISSFKHILARRFNLVLTLRRNL